MNDDVLTKLKAHVEKAVRPLRIGLLRKRRMREDLLAHIIEIYETETTKSDDEDNALHRTFERFGQPADIIVDLREGVSALEGVTWLIESQRFQPGDTWARLMARHLLAGCVWFVLVVPLAFQEFFQNGDVGELASGIRILGTVTGVLTIVASLLTLLSVNYSITMYSDYHTRSRMTACVTLAASLVVLPAMMLVIYWALGLGIPPEYMIIASFALTPVIPFLIVVMAKNVAGSINHEFEWAALRIDE